jgi:hypothetical protein
MDTMTTLDKGHGRQERRTLRATTALNGYLHWPGVQQVGMIESLVERNGKPTMEVRYFIISVPRSMAEAVKLLEWARGHWTIENPQSEDRRGDNLCALGGPCYHRDRRPVGVGRVERPRLGESRRYLMLSNEPASVPPRSRLVSQSH